MFKKQRDAAKKNKNIIKEKKLKKPKKIKQKKNKTIFINNMKIGVRLSLGFLIVILLAGVMGGTSYYGINNILDAVNKGNTADNIVKNVLEARKAETEFIHTGNEHYTGVVIQNISKVLNEANALKESIMSEEHNELIDNIIKNANEYQNAFTYVTQYIKEQKQLEEKMKEAGEMLLKNAKVIRLEQQAQYASLMAMDASTEEINESLMLSDEANSIIISVKDTNISYNNFLNTGKEESIFMAISHLSSIKITANNMKLLFGADEEREKRQLDNMINAVSNYILALDNYQQAIEKN